MECLGQLEAEQEEKQWLQVLQAKKQKLLQELDNLKRQTFPVPTLHQDVDTVEQRDCQTLTEIWDSYRILGVSVQSLGVDIVLRFDPVYRNQLPASESYRVQLVRRAAGFTIGLHNLPAWLPLTTLEKYLADSVQLFASNVRDVLYAYAQRRASVQRAQEEFQDDLESTVEVDLPVTYTKLSVRASTGTTLDITLHYKLHRCQPHTVHLDTEGASTANTQKHEQSLFKWKQLLLHNDICYALAKIIRVN